MKTKIFTIVTLFYFLYSFISCERDETRKYNRYGYVEGEARMFTKSGEVINNAEIQDFLDRYEKEYTNTYFPYPSFPLEKNISQYDNYDFILEILSDSQAQFIDNQDIVRSAKVEAVADALSFGIEPPIETFFNIKKEIYKFQPIIIEETPIPNGRTVYYITKFAYEVSDEIQFPIISFIEKIYYGENPTNINVLSGVNNSISDIYLLKITQMPSGWTDTIVFKESRIVFK